MNKFCTFLCFKSETKKLDNVKCTDDSITFSVFHFAGYVPRSEFKGQ